MKRLLSACVLLLMTSTLHAEQVIPGALHVITDCKKEVKAKPKDMVEIRIPNPVLPMRVHDLHVEATADAVLAGVVETTNGLPGGDRISIFVGLASTARSGKVAYAYKDGDNKEHKCEIIIQVIRN
jgi:hypothetical protein